MKKRLVIIGASAMGRETCAYAEESGWEVKGFLDSRPTMLDPFAGYPPVLSPVETYEVKEEDVFVSAVGDPKAKMAYTQLIESKGGAFATVIHPSVYIGRNVTLGTGCVICPKVSITNDTVVGDHVIVNNGTSINHDNRIGSGATICPGCHLAGRVTIGERVFLGIGTLVIPDIVLGSDLFVGAGSVVTRSFESGKVVGSPARQYG